MGDSGGFTTTDDLLEAIREYYMDDAAGSAGSWLLGPSNPHGVRMVVQQRARIPARHRIRRGA